MLLPRSSGDLVTLNDPDLALGEAPSLKGERKFPSELEVDGPLSSTDKNGVDIFLPLKLTKLSRPERGTGTPPCAPKLGDFNQESESLFSTDEVEESEVCEVAGEVSELTAPWQLLPDPERSRTPSMEEADHRWRRVCAALCVTSAVTLSLASMFS